MAGKNKKKAPKKTAVKQARKPAAKRVNKQAKKPATCAKKPTAAAKRQTTAKKKDIFSGATEVTMTKNKIVVTRTESQNKNGRFEKHEVKTYHNRTPARVRALNEKLTATGAEKFTVKLQ